LIQKEIEKILKGHKNIAIVGLSRNQEKDSYRVGAYLRKHGFRIIPVNPSATEILGERSYKSLLDIPVEVQKVIDIVDIFRPSEDVPLIVEQSIKLKERHGKPQVVWTQLGITNEDAAKAAETAGIAVVMNKCIMIEHTHLS
jgi:predicted CoA-binding protein